MPTLSAQVDEAKAEAEAAEAARARAELEAKIRDAEAKAEADAETARRAAEALGGSTAAAARAALPLKPALKKNPSRGSFAKARMEELKELLDANLISQEEFDAKRKHKRLVLLGVCAAILTSPVWFILMSADIQLLNELGVQTRFKLLICVWAGTIVLVDFLFWKLFPSRKVLPDLTAENPEWLKTGV